MSIHSKVRIYVHLIWGTYRRKRVLVPELRLKTFQHFVERAAELKIIICKMNIQPEHVHILLLLPADLTIAGIAKNLKGESSKWINDQHFLTAEFNWQRGYGAFSVSASQLEIVERYIKNQDAHHQQQTFQAEYKEWARRYGLSDDDEPDE
jgi:REP element-mobilizing transposase RayT